MLESSAKDCSAGLKVPEWCAQHLERQLVEARSYPREMVQLRSLRRLQRFAKLELFRALHSLGLEKRAILLIREMVSTQPLSQGEVLNLGPKAAKVAEREELTVDRFDRGKLTVHCDQACSVLVNETLVDKTVALPFGEYRVVICAADPTRPAITQTVRLHAQNSSAVLRAKTPEPKAKPERTQKLAANRQDPSPKRRPLVAESTLPDTSFNAASVPVSDSMLLEHPLVVPYLPRSALRAGVGIGLVGTMIGSTLVAMHGYWHEKNCLKDCPEETKVKTKPTGIGIISAGGAILLASTVMLLVERVRGKKAHAKWLRQWNANHRRRSRVQSR